MSEKAGAASRQQNVPASSTSTSTSQPHQGQQQQQQEDLPPAYTTTPSTHPTPIHKPSAIPGLPTSIDFTKYATIPSSELSKDGVTTTTTHPEFSSRPTILLKLLREQVQLPPKPCIVIKGTHLEYTREVVDFVVRVNVMGAIVRDAPPSGPLGGGGSWNYVKVLEEGEKGWRGGATETTSSNVGNMKGGRELTLEDWVRKFCADGGSVKSFQLDRELHNWNTELLEGRIRSLLSTLSYRGHLSISFPLSHSKLIISSSNSIGSIFPMFVTKKRYEVVKAIWPYARSTSSSPSTNEEADSTRYAVQSETSWWNDWKDAIARAVIQKRNGWVSTEDRLQALMAPPLRTATGGKKLMDWGIDY